MRYWSASDNVMKNSAVLHAIYIGTLCSFAYLAVYFARNILKPLK